MASVAPKPPPEAPPGPADTVLRRGEQRLPGEAQNAARPAEVVAALAAMVLCAQAFALIHEVNHDAGSETGRCTVCPIGEQLLELLVEARRIVEAMDGAVDTAAAERHRPDPAG